MSCAAKDGFNSTGRKGGKERVREGGGKRERDRERRREGVRKGERKRDGGKMHKYNSSVRQNYKSWLK